MAKKNIMTSICEMALAGKGRTKLTVNQCTISALRMEGFDVSVAKCNADAMGQGLRVEADIAWDSATTGIALDCRRKAEKRSKMAEHIKRDKHLSKKRRSVQSLRKSWETDIPADDDEETEEEFYARIAEEYNSVEDINA
ncbi:MAG: hypothetical protein IJ629_01800 [Clostridia bacterium]|nr:hypothetical protein [Clostridia bacterium]